LSLVYGPFSLQGEYFQTFLDSNASDDPEFEGYYIQGGYFLTGEHRNYSASNGYFTRVRSNQNFYPVKGGWGAWEVALRYSSIDLNDSDIRGGKEDDITAGLNWYLNPNVRFMFNYVYADLNDRICFLDGEVNIYQGRFQIDF
jgi:phosphate-selective porin OprO/OprP